MTEPRRTFLAPALPLLCSLLFSTLLASAAQASSEPKKSEGKAEAPAAPESVGPTDHYVHRWIAVPQFTGTHLGEDGGQVTVKPLKGRATMIVFLASWCEPCQRMIPDFLKLTKRYQRLDTDVVYVFAHDTKDDAEGFMKEYGIGEAVLGNQEILKAFHNPELPTIYVGDRHGWIVTRYARVGDTELKGLDDFLKTMTAF